MNTHADKTQESKSQSVANAFSKKSNRVSPFFPFADNRPEAIAQRKLQEMANNSPHVSQLRTFQEMADNSPLSVSRLPKGFGVLQRAIDVEAEERKDGKKVTSVVITANGKASDFSNGNSAQNRGWNGVDKYKALVKVGKEKIELDPPLSNIYLVAQAGHVLAEQNGGKGSDPDNVFAQDGGVNNATFRTRFENPMRSALSKANGEDKVKFRAVLYGENITKGPLEKESGDLNRSREVTPFGDFSSSSSSEESSSDESSSD